MPKVVIVMPAYRAVKTLEKTVASIPQGVADELLLVDDASPDGTADLARRLGLRVYSHPTNRGYGGNQKTCYTQALRDGADIVVLLHPDYQYEPAAVPLLIAPILAGRADMTFGSRFAGLSDPRAGGMPLYRYVGNRLTTTLENLMLGSRFTETHSGMRAYTRDCLLSLPFLDYSDDFAFDSQLLVDVITNGRRVIEVPIPTLYTKESSSIGIARSIRYVAASLMYCARRVLERGRRGRRNPVARPEASRAQRTSRDPFRSLSKAFGSDVHRGAIPGMTGDAIPQALGYLLRGVRVSAPPWGSPEARTTDVVVLTADHLAPGERRSLLQHSKEILDDEGLLVARDTDRSGTGSWLRLMREAGFTPIGWLPDDHETTVVARPAARRS